MVFVLAAFFLLPELQAQDTKINSEMPDSTGSGENDRAGLLDPSQLLISDSAKSLIGRKSMAFPKARFTWDCSGTVMATLFNAGLDLRLEYAQGSGNGVSRLYEIVRKAGLEYDPVLPETGDLIFFDNTYDKNGNKEWDDELTHVAVVISVDNDGTISYLHHDYRRGVVVAKMNLLVPDIQEVTLADGSIKVINSPLRMNKDRYLNPDRWLSSHLFRCFGRIRFYGDFSNVAAVQAVKDAQ